jgi:hypothetical protein
MVKRIINREGLAALIDVIDEGPTSFISYERAGQLLSAVGLSYRLACHTENWEQSITFCGPPSSLVPAEAEIETPFGHQSLTPQQYAQLPKVVQSALEQLSHVFGAIKAVYEPGLGLGPQKELVDRARQAEEDLRRGLGVVQRTFSFRWPMDRFQLLVEYGDRSAHITICGPLMALLREGFLSDPTSPGVGVLDMAEAAVKVLMDRTLKPSTFHSTANRMRDEAKQAVDLLRDYLASIPES